MLYPIVIHRQPKIAETRIPSVPTAILKRPQPRRNRDEIRICPYRNHTATMVAAEDRNQPQLFFLQ
jgi:hypothetical protein